MKTNYLLALALMILGFACGDSSQNPGGDLGKEMDAVDSLQQLYPQYAQRAAQTMDQVKALYVEIEPALDSTNSKHVALTRQFDLVLEDYQSRLAKNQKQIDSFEEALKSDLKGEALEKEYKKMRVQLERMLRNFERFDQDLQRLREAQEKVLSEEES